jgi:TlyA family rRNA methyltransferase/putative hemolysin
MKQEIKPATGRLGVLVVGVGGAVATTMIVGTLASRKGLAKPIGSITQLATMRMENNEEKLIKDVVPLTNLEDIVFGGWDIFPDNAYEAAMYAEVLKEKDLNGVKEELEAIKPMPAAFDHNWAKRLNGTHVKKAATRWEMVEQLRQDIRDFKAANNCERVVVLWAASTEIYIPLSDEHMSLAALEKAMKEFDISLEGMVCMDIGASTGGFTDCMLQNGAVKVYSVDVGYGQFAWKLRNDPRVVCMEKTNIRYVTPEDIADVLDFASVDVSFISLTKVLVPARELLRDGGRMVCLIKPQFEAGREKVGKKGVVRDPKVHEEVIHKVIDFALKNGFSVHNLSYSPIKGPEGNIEYLVYIEKNSESKKEETIDVDAIVEEAHTSLS